MDGLVFLAAIVGTFISAAVFRLGFYFHTEELRTGRVPKYWNRFIFTLLGLGGTLFYFWQATPFLSHLFMILMGTLIGLGGVHFVTDFLLPKARQAGLMSKR